MSTAQVVMLTGLAGPGIDIVPGDVCECTEAQAERFIERSAAREYDPKRDASRIVKVMPEAACISQSPDSSVSGKAKSPDTNVSGKALAAGGSKAPAKPLLTFEDSDIVIPLDQFTTAILLEADTGVTQEHVDALIAAQLVNFELIANSPPAELRKIKSIGKALGKIKSAIVAIHEAAVEKAQEIADKESDNSDEDHEQTNEDSASQASGAADEEA